MTARKLGTVMKRMRTMKRMEMMDRTMTVVRLAIESCWACESLARDGRGVAF